jgi:hypothetical protein
MSDEYNAGASAGRLWMIELLKRHDEFEARAVSEEEKFRRAAAHGNRLSDFDDGFFVAAEGVLMGLD